MFVVMKHKQRLVFPNVGDTIWLELNLPNRKPKTNATFDFVTCEM